jgi:hypothetical protein
MEYIFKRMKQYCLSSKTTDIQILQLIRDFTDATGCTVKIKINAEHQCNNKLLKNEISKFPFMITIISYQR